VFFFFFFGFDSGEVPISFSGGVKKQSLPEAEMHTQDYKRRWRR